MGTSPGELYSTVEVGDVGFIREGKFHRLFNVLLPADHPSQIFGVPEYHQPLELNIQPHIYMTTLSQNDFRSRGVKVESGGLGIQALGYFGSLLRDLLLLTLCQARTCTCHIFML